VQRVNATITIIHSGLGEALLLLGNKRPGRTRPIVCHALSVGWTEPRARWPRPVPVAPTLAAAHPVLVEPYNIYRGMRVCCG